MRRLLLACTHCLIAAAATVTETGAAPAEPAAAARYTYPPPIPVQAEASYPARQTRALAYRPGRRRHAPAIAGSTASAAAPART
jgi:hypothetical protein